MKRRVKTGSTVAVLLLVLAMVLVTAVISRGQDQALRPDRTRPPEFQKYIAVNYRLVDFIVTDRRGSYVRDLTRDDFELFENGEPVEIVSLDEYSMFLPTGGDYEAVETADFEYIQPPRNIIIFFDLFYSSSIGIRRAIEAAEEFVTNRIQPGDMVMILTYHGSLKTVQPFTDDKTQVIEAMRRVGLSSDGAFMRAEPPEAVEDRAEEVDQPDYGDELMEELRFIREYRAASDLPYQQHNIRNYLLSLKALAGAVKNYPGRKTLILLSEGFSADMIAPNVSLESDFSSLTRLETPEAMVSSPLGSLVRDWDDILNAMNDSNTSMYTVNVGGLKHLGGVDTLTHGADPATGTGGVLSEDVYSLRARQNTLSSFAERTGGRAYQNRNDLLAVLNDIEVDISNYYILGFRSEFDSSKPEFRDITVRMKNPRYRVLHRAGYYTPKPFGAMSDDEKLFNLDEGFISLKDINELGAVAAFEPLPVATDAVCMAISIAVPADDVEETSGVLEYELKAFNDVGVGEVHSGVHKLIRIKGSEQLEAIKQAGLRLVESLDLKPGRNRIRVVLRNNVNGKRAFFSLNRVFNPMSSDALLLSKPVFIREGEMRRSEDELKLETVLVKGENENVRAGADLLTHPEFGDIFPLLDPEFKRGSSASFYMTIGNLQLIPGEMPNLTIDTWLTKVDERGAVEVVGRLPVEKPQFLPYLGLTRFAYTTRFDTSAIEPGEYSLMVTVIDNKSDRRSKISSSFRVLTGE